MMGIPQELQEKIVQFEQLKQQVQVVAAQKIQLEGEKREIEETLNILNGIDADTPVYRKKGTIMVRVSDIDKLKKELEDKKETLELRVKSLTNQEETLTKTLENLQNEINAEIQEIQKRAALKPNFSGGAFKGG